MGNFDIALEYCCMGHGFRELITYADRLCGASGDFVVETICEGRALLLWVILLLLVELCGKSGVIWYIAVGELDLCALLLSQVGRWGVCAKGVLEILFICLRELCRNRMERGEDRVGN